MDDHKTFMDRAIALAFQGVKGGHGGPFGAVIVRDGKVVGEGHNCVLSATDPTAHAEITAIRAAAQNLHAFDLSGTTLYTNAFPCPMCMSAIFWARIDKVYYACTAEDAEAIGFDDQEFYRQLAKPAADRNIPVIQLPAYLPAARTAFQSWLERENRTPY